MSELKLAKPFSTPHPIHHLFSWDLRLESTIYMVIEIALLSEILLREIPRQENQNNYNNCNQFAME